MTRVMYTGFDPITERHEFLVEEHRDTNGSSAFVAMDGTTYLVAPGLAVQQEAYWRIEARALRPLFDAFGAALGVAGAPERENLRADYLHERDRVDKMIDTLVTLSVGTPPDVMVEMRPNP